MADSSPHPDPTELLVHAEWLQRLARSLVRDDAAAEDLVQDTWLRALRSGPRAEEHQRPWLARVLLNHLRSLERSRIRREQREADVAPSDTLPSTAALSERAESGRLLLDAVLDLPEAQRQVLLLSYFEGLSVARVASLTGSSEVAVRSRIARAVAALRESLDQRSGGDRARWLHALVPLARAPLVDPIGTSASLAPVALLGSLAMSTATKIVAAATAVLVLGLGVRSIDLKSALRNPNEEPGTELAPQSHRELAGNRSLDTDQTDLPVRRTSAAPAQDQEPPAEAQPPAATVESAVRIRVRLDGEPLTGLVAVVHRMDGGPSPWQLRVPANGEPYPLPPGPIRVELLRADLPLLTAMPKPSTGHVASGEDLALQARVSDGEIADVSFDLVRGARLYGMVRGADGRGFAAVVRATGDRASYDVATETGEYSMYLPPESFLITTFAADGAAMPRVKPFPSVVDLRPGDQVALNLVYDQGSVSIVGRWIDQDAKPWTNVIVRAVPMEIGDAQYRPTSNMAIHTARTDQQGAFRLGPLPPGRYGVSPSVLGQDTAGPGGFSLHPKRREVLATPADTLVDIGEQTAMRWVPLKLAGKIIAAEGTALYRYSLEVLAPTPVGGDPKQSRILLRRDGTFTLELSAHEPLTVTFILTGPQGETREAFSFDSGGQMEVILRPRR